MNFVLNSAKHKFFFHVSIVNFFLQFRQHIKVNTLRKTTEWLFLDYDYDEYELFPLMLLLGHNLDNIFYYFKHIFSIISGQN